jgi:alanine racemase
LIHLKFNTGLNRLGFNKVDILALVQQINKNKQLKIASVFSHLVASEDATEIEFTKEQIQLYNEITADLESSFSYSFFKHLSNTSGTLNYKNAHFDMVRIGIGLYGYANDKEETSKLKNVASLYSIISQIHHVSVGESVGYNRGFIAQKETISATISVGHADGIPRTWGSGVGFVLINGVKAPILGNVCMDMIMVDITEISCNEGDRVVIFDSQKMVEDLAKNAGTISYELLTAISQRVPRVIINTTLHSG